MREKLRKSGIEVLGDIPWGSHFCQFYETKEDLFELLIPYFKAGLENNEFCLWAIFDPIKPGEALASLKASVPDFQNYLEKKSIEIIDYTTFYFQDGKFDEKALINTITERLQNALAKGCDGMRVNGNETWLKRENWESFMKYENNLDTLVQNLPVIVLCTYPLAGLDASTLLDVAHAHDSIIAKRKGRWEIFEKPEIKKLKAELQQRGDELEQRVAERTSELKKEIGERKKAEAKFKTIVEQSLVGFYIITNGKFAYVNSQLAKIFGYAQDELIDSYPVEAVIHPDDREMVIENVRVRMEGEKETLHYEAKGLKKSGETIWIEVFCKGTLGEKTKAIMGTILDITERKKAEEKLRQSENLLIEAEHLAHVGSWSLDLSNNTVTWSDEVYKIFGVDPLEFDHTLETVIGFSHPADKNLVTEVVEKAVATHKPYDFHYRIVRSDGEERILHVHGAVATDEHGDVSRLYGAVQDVTESKKAEDELRFAYQRLSYHVENTPLAVIEFDKDLFIKRWSKRAEEIFGWKVSEALGKNVHDPDFRIIYEEDVQAVDKINEELIKGMVNGNLSLNRNYTKEGKVIYNEWYNSVLKDEQRNVITILSLTHDVTERKISEQKLNESYKQIRYLSEHLQNIREEERTHIAREIHDELGQQLTVMKMDILWLSKKLSDNGHAVKERFHDLIEILDSTVESVRRISYELRPYLLDLGLDAAIEWHLKEFEKRSGIETSFNDSQETAELADSLKTGLFRIFQESLTNVARHSKATHLQVDLLLESAEIILRITDNGRGFDMRQVTEKKTLGILGMKERAAMMGGNYTIESTLGKGTAVTVRIPFKKSEDL